MVKKRRGSLMCNPLTEKCYSCTEGITISETSVVSTRICCNCEYFEEKVEVYKTGILHTNPCSHCSRFNRCKKQLVSYKFLD